jgi:hypothetical protein
MTMNTTVAQAPAGELAAAVLETVERKAQPMTASQVRDNLPRRFREQTAEIGRCLEELVGQGRLHAWPAYRSKAARFATRPMDQAARETLTRLLGEGAFTRSELFAAVRREVAGLEDARLGQILDEVLATGQVRKLPPRLGGSAHLLGTPHPRSYLAPLFEALGKSLERLLPRLESEGVLREQVLQEADALWDQTLRRAEAETASGQGSAPATPHESPAAAVPDERENPDPGNGPSGGVQTGQAWPPT